jgi:LytR cell envelope-related transcriptional attenuator
MVQSDVRRDQHGPTPPRRWPRRVLIAADLARIVRDHTFLRVLVSTAESEGLTNPLKANAFLGAVLNQLTVDPGLKNQLISLITHYHHLDPFSSPETTIPVTQVTGTDNNGYIYDGVNVGDVEYPDQPADLDAIKAWDPTALPTPIKPDAVQIYNIAGTAQLATDTGTALRADGLNVTLETDGTVPGNESETIVQYAPGQLAQGLAVFEHLDGAVILQSVAGIPPGTVDVQAGSVLAVDQPTPKTTPTKHRTTRRRVKRHAAATTTTTTPTPTTTTTIPTPGGQAASPAVDQETPYDPKPC